ncbi:MAG: hypothetical protein HYS56_05290 [Candidatus Omnitrophica bacterium]|nr:hypothetical protein [Candidatus Omnitrophota bacterium]
MGLKLLSKNFLRFACAVSITHLNFLAAPPITNRSLEKAIVPSHEIEEEWRILPETDLEKKRIVAQVRFLHQDQPIGEAWVDMDPAAVSIHACHLKSHRRGQGLGKEFAARIYERAYQLSQRLGLETKIAHAYFTLSRFEELDLDYRSSAGVQEFFDGIDRGVFARIFRPLGLASSPLKGKSYLNGYSGDRYSDHHASLEEVVQTIRRNWPKWFYKKRGVVLTKKIQRILESKSDIILESIQKQLQQFQQQQENLRILSSI